MKYAIIFQNKITTIITGFTNTPMLRRETMMGEEYTIKLQEVKGLLIKIDSRDETRISNPMFDQV